METLEVLVKVSEKCPLSCVYCYAGDKTSNVMDKQTLQNMLKILENRENGKRTTYVWHGAEPMTAGLEFYKKVVELQKIYGKTKIRNSMQSSGVLLTPELADFFAENQFHIGFSVDGPEHVHNTTRPYCSGKGSHKKVMKSIELMRSKGQTPGVIGVLSKLTLPFIDEIYDYFKEQNLSFKLNPLIQCGYATKKQEELYISIEEQVQAVCHLFDRWISDTEKVNYSNVVDFAKSIFTKNGSVCNSQENCQDNFLSVGYDGTVYPCSRFSEKEISYGNINSVASFKEIEQHPLRQALLQRYNNLASCKSCDYTLLCYGGCMHNAYIAGDIMGKDPNCAAEKKIIEYISSVILLTLKEDGALQTCGVE